MSDYGYHDVSDYGYHDVCVELLEVFDDDPCLLVSFMASKQPDLDDLTPIKWMVEGRGGRAVLTAGRAAAAMLDIR